MLRAGADGPQVCQFWPGGSRGCDQGHAGQGHSWPCPPDAPWCGHCKALAPEYIKAAALLAAESAKTRLAKVDGPSEPELTKEFAVTEYPTLMFFRDGNRTNPEEYTGTGAGLCAVVWARGRAQADGTLHRPPGSRGHC